MLRVASASKAVQIISFVGNGYSERDDLSVVVASSPARLTAKIERITYKNAAGAVIANPAPSESQAVGDSFRLTFVKQNILRREVLVSHLPSIDQKSANPYLCGPQTRDSSPLCGA
jgi:hypothetical protein